MNSATDSRMLPDLAVRSLGGSVTWANDECFAQRENLIRPEPATFDHESFDHKGKVYDGWETRRRREPGYDQAIVRLGAAGIPHEVVIDTAWFKGNYPPEASVEATCVSGYPSAEELNRDAIWQTIVARSVIKGDQQNSFPVESQRRFTHVRLTIYPDGGVARLRVHGEVVPDPRLLDVGGIDLAALDNGGLVVGCSNMFYSSPNNLISPGLIRSMGEGWETARRRDDGNDWVSVHLAAQGTIRVAELDTSYFIANSPGWASLRGCVGTSGDPRREQDWFELLPRTRLQPDTRHRFVLPQAQAATQVRLDIYPDGGMARLRLLGELTAVGRQQAGLRWFNSLPADTAIATLVRDLGLSSEAARTVASARPIADIGPYPREVRRLLAGTAHSEEP